MTKGPGSISTLEQQVMLAILRLHPIGYGITIRDELEKQTGVRHSIGSIYATLDRIVRKGFAKTRAGEATAERGGKAKLHFELTGEGRQSLDAAMNALDSLRRGTDIGAFARRLGLMEA